MPRPVLFLLLATACTHDRGDIVVATTADLAPVLSDFIELIGDERIRLAPVDASDDGEDAIRTARRYANGVTVLVDPSLAAGSFAGTRAETGPDQALHLVGSDILGVQYALAAALESRGYAFYHPQETVIPEDLATTGWEPSDWDGTPNVPEQSVRGLDPHTLHPIEFLQDAWVPGDDSDGLDRARRVVDWLVKNRGNQLQWPALENILTSSSDGAEWAEHTAALVDYAHDRGVTTAIGVQLFGGANLQEAFDLVDDASASSDERREVMDQRLRVLLHPEDGPAVAFDKVNLSFGEFSGEDPEVFLENINLFAEVLRDIADEEGREIEPDATIHVGADQSVTYNDQEILYYFLVKYADPTIVPYIHSVMYYNLYDDAGGAYGHDDFSEHRQYLMDRMDAGQRVAYFPESAYWCAFDNPLPLYLPVYIKSRFLDMKRLADDGYPLDQHVTFSSGWEWGYWQTDISVLRMGWKLPETWEEVVRRDLASLPGPTQDGIIALGDLQYDALITGRLAPWMAGRDAFMDIGRSAGIVAQPDRPTFAELVGLSAADRALFGMTVVEPLRQFGRDTRALLGPVQAAGSTSSRGAAPLAASRWQREVEEGIEIDALRAEYMTAVLDAVLAHAAGDPATAAGRISEAEALKSAADFVVERRHEDLHDPVPGRLTALADNPTLYDYGYLRHADTLCFWERDRVQVRNLVLGETTSDPGCTFD